METFTVVYRTGGFKNAVWKPTLPFNVLQDAERTQRQIQETGSKALIYPTDELLKVGLPQGWEPQQVMKLDKIRQNSEIAAKGLAELFPKDEAAEMIAECMAVPMPTKTDLQDSKKMRKHAESYQNKIDDCFSERQENTPKRMYQAGNKRIEGRRYKRAQKGFNVLADLYFKGECPYILKSVYTKKEMFDLVACKMDFSQGGHYSPAIEIDEPYHQSEKALLLWSLISDRSPADKKKEELHRKIKNLQFAKIPGYFPTPRAVIEKMLEHADIQLMDHVLEPSAGSGALADAIQECIGESGIIKFGVLEVNHTLREILEAKGHALVGSDFLKFETDERFDRILQNPPFEGLQDVDHVMHAHPLLKPGGRLVSIMSPGAFFNSHGRAKAFRYWFEELGGECIDLPENSFKESGTGVASKLIIIDKE